MKKKLLFVAILSVLFLSIFRVNQAQAAETQTIYYNWVTYSQYEDNHLLLDSQVSYVKDRDSDGTLDYQYKDSFKDEMISQMKRLVEVRDGTTGELIDSYYQYKTTYNVLRTYDELRWVDGYYQYTYFTNTNFLYNKTTQMVTQRSDINGDGVLDTQWRVSHYDVVEVVDYKNTYKVENNVSSFYTKDVVNTHQEQRLVSSNYYWELG